MALSWRGKKVGSPLHLAFAVPLNGDYFLFPMDIQELFA
jgi:hypothetical protein